MQESRQEKLRTQVRRGAPISFYKEGLRPRHSPWGDSGVQTPGSGVSKALFGQGSVIREAIR
jgi:hypothetical protein